MLVMSRKKNESIIVNHDIVITVVELRGDKVRLGIVAPKQVSVHRLEVYEAIHGAKVSPLGGFFDGLDRLLPPVLLDPEWCTSTVVALARGILESGDFSTMPILADALQDAGCDNEMILSHCRDVATANGQRSWVVDLVLGKS